MRRAFTDFVSRRPHDRYALVLFANSAMRILPFTEDVTAVRAGIAATSIGRGLTETDIGRALLAGIEAFKDRAYTGSRVIVLVSDGGAVIDPPTQARIREGLAKERISLYFIYIRSATNSPDLYQDSVGPIEASTPEWVLHGWFRTLRTPYRVFQASDPASIDAAVTALDRQQNLPLDVRRTHPACRPARRRAGGGSSAGRAAADGAPAGAVAADESLDTRPRAASAMMSTMRSQLKAPRPRTIFTALALIAAVALAWNAWQWHAARNAHATVQAAASAPVPEGAASAAAQRDADVRVLIVQASALRAQGRHDDAVRMLQALAARGDIDSPSAQVVRFNLGNELLGAGPSAQHEGRRRPRDDAGRTGQAALSRSAAHANRSTGTRATTSTSRCAWRPKPNRRPAKRSRRTSSASRSTCAACAG